MSRLICSWFWQRLVRRSRRLLSCLRKGLFSGSIIEIKGSAECLEVGFNDEKEAAQFSFDPGLLLLILSFMLSIKCWRGDRRL